MESINYYIFAIKGKWMHRYKIGYYIADLKSLKNVIEHIMGII